jgi:UDP-glucose:(glucosyl)LPS alpha-1,2-glucosyltransferase
MKAAVAHLLPNYNPFPPTYAAGTELRVEKVSHLQTRYRPVVVCGWFAGQDEVEERPPARIRRIRIGRAYRRLFQKLTRLDPVPYAERMCRILLEEKTALAHIHNEPKLLAGLYPRLRETALPVVVHVANEKPLPAHAVHRVARWVACSRFIAQWLERDNAIPAERIQVIYTGVDTDARPAKWQVPEAARRGLRKRFGVADQDTVLVFAGRLVKEKGVAELLDAFERLRSRGTLPKLKLLVAGNVRESDDPGNEKAVYGKAIAERIARTPDARWVGSLNPAQMHDFLLAGDIFVMPSLWHDPFPTVMLEAAAAGLPIVAAARGGITEFLQGCPDFAFVENPADPDSIAEGIARYASSPAARDNAGHWLRERVERGFTWTRVCTEFEDMYDRLLHGAGRPA